MSEKTTDPIYRVRFFNQNEVYEIYAKHVFQSDLWGFLEVEEFVFGERTQMIVDPAEEKLKTEFGDIKRSFIPIQAVVRIDEVEKKGPPKSLRSAAVISVLFLINPWSQRSPKKFQFATKKPAQEPAQKGAQYNFSVLLQNRHFQPFSSK